MTTKKPKVDAAPAPTPAPTPAPIEAVSETPRRRVPRVERFLMSMSNGRILGYTEMLAERADMVECSADGIPLKPVAGKLASRALLELERKAELARQGLSAMSSTPDTFGRANNPVSPGEPEAPFNDLTAGMDHASE